MVFNLVGNQSSDFGVEQNHENQLLNQENSQLLPDIISSSLSKNDAFDSNINEITREIGRNLRRISGEFAAHQKQNVSLIFFNRFFNCH